MEKLSIWEHGRRTTVEVYTPILEDNDLKESGRYYEPQFSDVAEWKIRSSTNKCDAGWALHVLDLFFFVSFKYMYECVASKEPPPIQMC